ncbi:hypothetical protein BG004_000151, partial [Podila humilis]
MQDVTPYLTLYSGFKIPPVRPHSGNERAKKMARTKPRRNQFFIHMFQARTRHGRRGRGRRTGTYYYLTLLTSPTAPFRVSSVVRELFEFYHTEPHSNETKLDKAFDSAIGLQQNRLNFEIKLRDLVDGDRTDEVAHLRRLMVSACKIQDRISFANETQKSTSW